MPVSSRTSRAAVCSGVSPAIRPALRQPEHAPAPARDDHEHLVAADDDPAVGRLALSRHSRCSAAGIVDGQPPAALRDHACALEHGEEAAGRLARGAGELREVGLRGGDRHVALAARPRAAPARRAGRARRRRGSARSGTTGRASRSLVARSRRAERRRRASTAISACSRISRRMSAPRIASASSVVDRLDGRRAALVVEHRQLAEDVAGAERGERDLAPVGVLADRARVAASGRCSTCSSRRPRGRRPRRPRSAAARRPRPRAPRSVGAELARRPAPARAARRCPRRGPASAGIPHGRRATGPSVAQRHAQRRRARARAGAGGRAAAASPASSATSAERERDGERDQRDAGDDLEHAQRVARRVAGRPAAVVGGRRRRRRPRSATSVDRRPWRSARAVVDAPRPRRWRPAISARHEPQPRADRARSRSTVSASASWRSRLVRSVARVLEPARGRRRTAPVMSSRALRALAHRAEPRERGQRGVEVARSGSAARTSPPLARDD